MIYRSPKMIDITGRCRSTAHKDKDVLFLIGGETGVGKNVLARFIHDETPARCQYPFIEASLSRDDNLLDSELYGYKPGAFTGAAVIGHDGAFTRAKGGTVFLNEIGDLSPQGQFKLLKVLDDGQYLPVGGNDYLTANVRIIAATNKPLDDLRAGTFFRQDLYYRFGAETVIIPPLRERPEDIVPLAEYFMGWCNQKYHTSYVLGEDDKSLLLQYPFPGNIRELKNAIQGAVLWSDAEFNTVRLMELLPAGGVETTPKLVYEPNPALQCKILSLAEVCRETERKHIRGILIATNYNISRAAQRLGISRLTLRRKMELYGLDRPPDNPLTRTG